MLELERRTEIYGTEFDGEWIEIHVDATPWRPREVTEVFTQSGFVSAKILSFAKEEVSKIK
jgi:hypothetical protein